jgi:hypothetical protein
MAWDERNEALRRAAEMAAVTPKGAWTNEDQYLRDGISAYRMPYGRFPVKADVDVTEEDIQNYNLLLLGDPRHNQVIQRIQKGIPVQINGSHIRTSDGHSWPFQGAILGLLHYNPLAPHRLIYWIAADRTEDYGPGTISPKHTLTDIQSSYTVPAADFMILGASQTEILAARRFDSRWRWEPGYAESPRFAGSMPVTGPNAEILATVLKRSVGADFGMTRGRDWNSTNLRALAGVTRIADVRSLFFDNLAGRLTLTGQELIDLHRLVKSHSESTEPLSQAEWRELGRFVPVPRAGEIDPTAPYTVALPARQVFGLARFAKIDGRNFTFADQTVREAWTRWAPALLESGGGKK